MFYKHIKYILFLFLFLGQNFYAQTFTEITTNDKCATPDDRIISVNFKFEGAAFSLDNNFIIDLSDASGDFTNVTNVGELTDDINNVSFDVTTNLNIPRTIEGGDGYRIRVTSSLDPTKFIESTETYSFYYQPDAAIVLSNPGDVFLCNNQSAEIDFEVNFFENIGRTSSDYSYMIFKDFEEYAVTEETSFVVTEEGSYFITMNLGSECSSIIAASGSSGYTSNIIDVSVLDVSTVVILGDNEIEMCAGETYALESGLNDEDHIYKWYKDDVLIEGLLDYQPIYNTPSDGSQFGIYRLDIEVGNCIESSQEVEIIQKDARFTVSAVANMTTENESIVVLLPGSQIVLNAVIEPFIDDDLEYVWFNAETDIRQGVGDELNVFFEGEYYVQVTDNSGDCPIVINSDPITFLDAVSLEPSILQDDENCMVESTILRLGTINAIASDGNSYPLSSEEIINFSYQWVKGNNDILGENSDSYEVPSYQENDFYLLTVSAGTGAEMLMDDSNILEILLRPNSTITSSSSSNQLCPGSEINLSIDALVGFTYTWFKDGEELVVEDPSTVAITEVGSYSVTYEGFGCSNTIEPVEIIEFTDDGLEVSPSTQAILIDGQILELTASGADFYEWYDASGDLLSTASTIEVEILGTYTLIGQIESCSVEKEVVVIADDGGIIVPNIISPFNGNSANDTWKIPNRLSFQPTVNVLIYNSKGREVVNTNDYQNNWPEDINDVSAGMLFYYKIIQNNTLIKTGTISVLE